MHNLIKIYQKVHEIGPVSLFSEFEPRQNLDKSQMSFGNLTGYILSISMCMQNFITIFLTVQEIGPFSLWSSEKPRPIKNVSSQFLGLDHVSQMLFDYLMGYILSISMCMQNFITRFYLVQEIAPLSLFQNLELGKASTDEKCHFAISWARFCQYQVYAKVYQDIPLSSRDRAIFHFFRNWRSAKPRPMINVILQ